MLGLTGSACRRQIPLKTGCHYAMDYPSFVNSAVNPLWLLVPLAVAIGILRSPWFKGRTGEALVRLAARLRLPSEEYTAIHNVTLPTSDGTTQIDHIFVSRFGVFVVETKRMKGWIFGSEGDAQWTQTLYRNSFKFQNPLRQNFKHVKALEMALDIPSHVIHSVVVFSGQCTFKTAMPANVVRGGGYIGFIKAFQQQVLSDAEVEEIRLRIGSSRLPGSFATRRMHLNNLRSRGDPTAARSCPRCGNRMVLRTVKQGRKAGSRFWGCSTYPRCRGVQNFEA